jgi:uncharacterized membrane protein
MTASNAAPNEDAAQTWRYENHKLSSNNFTMALVHLYRAEISRTNVWRSRLDTTTNWAVATAGAALTFTFSAPENPHFILLLMLILILAFFNIEARRYRYYALWHHRVRLLETDFLAAMLVSPYEPAQDWGDALSYTLTHPRFHVSQLQALSNRYRRNYFWLISLLLISWWLKLARHPQPARSFADVLARAAIEPIIPGAWVIGVVMAIYAGLGIAALITTYQMKKASPTRREYGITGLLRGDKKAPEQLAIIITGKREQIAEELMQEIKRGVTALHGAGMYTGQPRDVLLCALTQVQIARLREIVRAIDPNAFIVINPASYVQGYGFEPSEPPS